MNDLLIIAFIFTVFGVLWWLAHLSDREDARAQARRSRERALSMYDLTHTTGKFLMAGFCSHARAEREPSSPRIADTPDPSLADPFGEGGLIEFLDRPSFDFSLIDVHTHLCYACEREIKCRASRAQDHRVVCGNCEETVAEVARDTEWPSEDVMREVLSLGMMKRHLFVSGAPDVFKNLPVHGYSCPDDCGCRRLRNGIDNGEVILSLRRKDRHR
jgi:uncharacterized membrane protein YsdA (DUF1294 family)